MGVQFSKSNKYYALNKQIDSSELYPPIMTANDSPTPYVATASSNINISTTSYRAFTRISNELVNNTKAYFRASESHWLQLYCGSNNSLLINGILLNGLINSGINSKIPNFIKLQGSNDGVNFSEIASITGYVWDTTDEYFYFDNEIKYTYFRVVFDFNTSSVLVVNKINFLVVEYSGVVVESKNIIKNSSTTLKLDKNYERKDYILQKIGNDSADGLWKQELNRKPLSIKFE